MSSSQKQQLEYQDFLRSKVRLAETDGFEIDESEINPILKPHQKACVKWAVRGGRRALFESFGLGKSIQQLEILRIILAKLGSGRALIVAPLGVRQEFKRDAVEKLGWEKPPVFVRTNAEVLGSSEALFITNYESVRDGKLDPTLFDAVSLDEASCLRGFGGTKTFREFMALFAGDRKTMNKRTFSKGIKYRFVATATPSPNEYIELLAYSAFLDIMDVSSAKTRFFKRDSTKADNLTLHPHKEKEFWLWVSSWAMFLQKPSDLGYDDTGYDLPEMKVHYHEVAVDHTEAQPDKHGQGQIFRNAASGVIETSREKRTTLGDRVERMLEIIRNDFRRESEISAGILPQEPRAAVGEAEGSECQELSCESGEIRGQEPALEGRESGKIQGSSEALQPGKPRKGKRALGGVVQEQQSSGECDQSKEQIEGVRSRSGDLCGDAEESERVLQDLPSADEAAENRPLPQDRSGSGAALQPLQHLPGRLSGRSEDIETGDPVFDQFLVWCDLNDEQRAIEKALDAEGISYSSIFGSQSVEIQEEKLEEWRSKKTVALIGKPMMLGSGLNLQQCNKAIFAGINYKFNDFLQATKRIHRYLQYRPVQIHIIYAESEKLVLESLRDNGNAIKSSGRVMTDIMREYGLSHEAMASELRRGFGVIRSEVKGDNFTIVNNDSVLEAREMETDSVGLILTSVPFSTQYEYSPNYSDFGHTDNNEHFFDQMAYLTPNLLRILQPGRLALIHVKDRIVPGGLTGLGFQTVYPFHARCIEHYKKHGFAYMGMKTIVTDVVRENNQTYRLGWSEQCKDGTKMGVGMPEYLLIFRKPPTDNSNAYGDFPVVKSKEKYSRARWQVDAHGFARSSGDRLLASEELREVPHSTIFKLFKRHSLENVYDFEKHVRLGEGLDRDGRLPVTFMLLQPQSWHPDVWTDITRMLTLNSAQYAKGKQMHLCPLQFDIVDRAINQWTNEGDLVFDPFAGIGTVPYRAVKLGRKGYGVELSEQYFLDAIAYCEAAERESAAPSLFDLMENEEGEELAEKAA
jgi:hypothetical protein